MEFDRGVTVVMPVYNGEKYLAEAIDSVISQSCRCFRFIICDDGSVDNSLAIISEYKKRYEWIVVLKNEKNIGLFPTLNKLIRASETDLIRLFAQDDILNSECLDRELIFAKNNQKVGLFYCGRDIIDNNGFVVKMAPIDNTPKNIDTWLADQISFYKGSMPGNIANVTLRKNALNNVGLFDEAFKVSGDFEMWTRVASKYPIGFVNETLMCIRDHAGQFSRHKNSIIDFIIEDRIIFKNLRHRLPENLRDYAYAYDEYRRGIFYMHAYLKLIGSGDFYLAKRLLSEIKLEWSGLKLFVLWLISINRRLFQKKPRYLEPNTMLNN